MAKLSNALVLAIASTVATAEAICEASGRSAPIEHSQYAVEYAADCDVIVTYDTANDAYSVCLAPRNSYRVLQPALVQWWYGCTELALLLPDTDGPSETFGTRLDVDAWRTALARLADVTRDFAK